MHENWKIHSHVIIKVSWTHESHFFTLWDGIGGRQQLLKFNPLCYEHRTLDWRYYALSLQQYSDSEILLKCSTSPSAEGPDFVDNERRYARNTERSLKLINITFSMFPSIMCILFFSFYFNQTFFTHIHYVLIWQIAFMNWVTEIRHVLIVLVFSILHL